MAELEFICDILNSADDTRRKFLKVLKSIKNANLWTFPTKFIKHDRNDQKRKIFLEKKDYFRRVAKA